MAELLKFQNVTKYNKTLKLNITIRVSEGRMVDFIVNMYVFIVRQEIRRSLPLAVTCEIEINSLM